MLIANFRSLPLMGLQIGSPSKLTRSARVLLKKIAGGSALKPSTALRHDQALVDVREYAIESDHQLGRRECLRDFGEDIACLLARERREVRLGDPDARQVHQPLVQRGGRICFEFDRSERRLCVAEMLLMPPRLKAARITIAAAFPFSCGRIGRSLPGQPIDRIAGASRPQVPDHIPQESDRPEFRGYLRVLASCGRGTVAGAQP